jgi:hypothetical protein
MPNLKYYDTNSSTWKTLVIGKQGESAVAYADSPATYDSETKTIGINESAISISKTQVTGLAAEMQDALIIGVMGAI